MKCNYQREKGGTEWEVGNVDDVCVGTAPLASGDAVLFKGDIVHRGGAHTDAEGGER